MFYILKIEIFNPLETIVSAEVRVPGEAVWMQSDTEMVTWELHFQRRSPEFLFPFPFAALYF